MNWHLFAGFLAITMVLLLAPGPIVTLVISTSATRGMRAGLITVAGTSTGNAVLIAATWRCSARAGSVTTTTPIRSRST